MRTKGMDAPAGHAAGLAEGAQEEMAVGVILENGLPAIAAGHELAQFDPASLFRSPPSRW